MNFTFAQLKVLKTKYRDNMRVLPWLLAYERQKLDGCRTNQQVRM